MKTLTSVLGVALLLAASSVHAAGCTARDNWTGPDKNKHFAAGVVLGTAGTLVFKDPDKAFLLGAAVGAAKELADLRGWVPGSHTCSLQDFVVTAAGAAAGAYGTAWLVLPQKGGLQVAIAKRF